MVHPLRDFCLAVALFVVGLAAALWGLPAVESETPRVLHTVALSVGGLCAFFGFFITLNFGWALRLQQRLRRGDTVIARWKVPPDLMRLHVAAEARREGMKPHWRPSSHDVASGLEVIFGPEVVLLGNYLYSIPSSGMQSIRAVRLEPGPPPVLEFQTQLYMTKGHSVPSLTVSKGLLRVPAAGQEEVEAVRRYFQEVLSGTRLIAPDRWGWRIRLGLRTAACCFVLLLVGWGMAEAMDWRADNAAGIVAIGFLILGPIGTVAGLFLAGAARVFELQQRGKA